MTRALGISELRVVLEETFLENTKDVFISVVVTSFVILLLFLSLYFRTFFFQCDKGFQDLSLTHTYLSLY